MSRKLATLCGWGLSLMGASAGAHHSFAMFDATQTITAEGTVVEFQWTNPHSWLEVMIPDPAGSGEIQQWSLELAGPVFLASLGWKPSTFKPGEQVSVAFRPLKSGEPGGEFLSVTKEDGEVLICCRPTIDE